MTGFSRVHEKGRTSGAGQRCRDLVSDVPRFPHSGNHNSAAAAKHEAEEQGRPFDPEQVEGPQVVYQIQGTGATSPYVGQTVITSGVVTARAGALFVIQDGTVATYRAKVRLSFKHESHG